MVFYTLKMMLSSTLCPTHAFLYCRKTSKEGLSNLVTQSVQRSSCQTSGGSDGFLISTLLIHLGSWRATGWPNGGWKEGNRTYSATTCWVMMTSLMVVERKDSDWVRLWRAEESIVLEKEGLCQDGSAVPYYPRNISTPRELCMSFISIKTEGKGLRSHPSTLSL